MSVPSREFMIQQATLDAHQSYEHPEDGGAKHRLSRAACLKGYTLGNYVRDSFCEEVRRHFRRISEQYQGEERHV